MGRGGRLGLWPGLESRCLKPWRSPQQKARKRPEKHFSAGDAAAGCRPAQSRLCCHPFPSRAQASLPAALQASRAPPIERQPASGQNKRTPGRLRCGGQAQEQAAAAAARRKKTFTSLTGSHDSFPSPSPSCPPARLRHPETDHHGQGNERRVSPASLQVPAGAGGEMTRPREGAPPARTAKRTPPPSQSLAGGSETSPDLLHAKGGGGGQGRISV